MFFGEWPVPDAPALLTRIANRVLEARESGTKVIFVQNDGPEGELDAPGMPYWQLALAPGAGERVVNKTTQNVFESSPNLASQLQESGIKTLELIGLQSELCLYSSVLGALENGFMVEISRELHGTYDSESESAGEISDRIQSEIEALIAK